MSIPNNAGSTGIPVFCIGIVSSFTCSGSFLTVLFCSIHKFLLLHLDQIAVLNHPLQISDYLLHLLIVTAADGIVPSTDVAAK